MTDFVAFVGEMDRCWMERRFDALARYLADDVVMVAPGGQIRMNGIDAAVGSYREFMSRSEVTRYETSDCIVTERGDAAVVEYGWDMAWESGGETHEATGREVLVLACRAGEWRVVWRTQISG